MTHQSRKAPILNYRGLAWASAIRTLWTLIRCQNEDAIIFVYETKVEAHLASCIVNILGSYYFINVPFGGHSSSFSFAWRLGLEYSFELIYYQFYWMLSCVYVPMVWA